MSLLEKIGFWGVLLFFSTVAAQGDDNLLMQYNKGPDLDGFYRKWNFDLHAHMIYGKLKEDDVVYKISYSAGAYVQFKFSKTFALSSGTDFYQLSYQYNLSKNQSYDKLTYLSFPLTIRAFPSRKLHFETGLLYHHLIEARNTEIVDLRKQSPLYPEGVFKNVFGWLFGVQYNVWKRLDVSLQYRFLKKASDLQRLQKNHFEAFQLGLHFYVLNPQKKPK